MNTPLVLQNLSAIYRKTPLCDGVEICDGPDLTLPRLLWNSALRPKWTIRSSPDPAGRQPKANRQATGARIPQGNPDLIRLKRPFGTYSISHRMRNPI